MSEISFDDGIRNCGIRGPPLSKNSSEASGFFNFDLSLEDVLRGNDAQIADVKAQCQEKLSAGCKCFEISVKRMNLDEEKLNGEDYATVESLVEDRLSRSIANWLNAKGFPVIVKKHRKHPFLSFDIFAIDIFDDKFKPLIRRPLSETPREQGIVGPTSVNTRKIGDTTKDTKDTKKCTPKTWTADEAYKYYNSDYYKVLKNLPEEERPFNWFALDSFPCAVTSVPEDYYVSTWTWPTKYDEPVKAAELLRGSSPLPKTSSETSSTSSFCFGK